VIVVLGDRLKHLLTASRATSAIKRARGVVSRWLGLANQDVEAVLVVARRARANAVAVRDEVSRLARRVFESAPSPSGELTLVRYHVVYRYLIAKRWSGVRCWFLFVVLLYGVAAGLTSIGGTFASVPVRSGMVGSARGGAGNSDGIGGSLGATSELSRRTIIRRQVVSDFLSWRWFVPALNDYAKSSRPLPFAGDYAIALILVFLLPVHSAVVVALWRSIGTTLRQLKDDGGIVFSSDEAYGEFVTRHDRYFNRPTTRWICLLGAFTATLLCWVVDRGRSWWGDLDASWCSIAAFWWIGVVIWYQLFLHNAYGNHALRLAHETLSRDRLRLHAFHVDQRYGLGCVVRVYLLVITTTIIHGTAMYALMLGHFLSSSLSALFVVILLFVVVFTPLFIVLPVIILFRRTAAYRSELLSSVRREMSLIRLHGESRELASIRRPLRLAALLMVEERVRRMPRHPFPRFAMVGVGFGYVLQLASALVTIYVASHGPVKQVRVVVPSHIEVRARDVARN
jgi:hypothetical protein